MEVYCHKRLTNRQAKVSGHLLTPAVYIQENACTHWGKGHRRAKELTLNLRAVK